MASIFEQYETQQKTRGGAGESSLPSSAVSTALFRGLKLEDETPLFSKQRINFQPGDDIVTLVVCNNHLSLALSNNVIIRINLLRPQDLEEVDVSKQISNSKINNLFLDNSGQHLLISTMNKKRAESNEVFYLPSISKKVKPIGKLKGHFVTSVSWSQRNSSEQRTGPFICGTSKGQIFELELSAEDSMFQSGFEQYCKPLHSLDSPEVISGLEILPCPTNDLDYVIMFSTKSCLTYIRGKMDSTEARPLFSTVFSSGKSNTIEYNGSIEKSILKLYHQPSTMMASSIAWTNGQGIMYGEINWTTNPDNILQNVKLIKTTRDVGSSKILSQGGCGLVVTPFHLIIPHENEVTVVCHFNEKVVMNDQISASCGAAVGIGQDIVKGTIWMYASRGIFKCKLDREDRNAWKMYLDEGKFEQAKKYCFGDQMKLFAVRMKEAECLFETKDYVNSAKIFAHTLMPFEQIFFKLNSVDDDEGLCVYLLEKLTTLSEGDQGQFSLIVLVMLEYYFNRLGQLRDVTNDHNDDFVKVNQEFENFLKKPKILDTLEKNSNSVYHLLSSHADKSNIIKISLMIKAFDRVVLHLINTNRHMEALTILDENGSEKLFFDHLSTLLKVIPVPTIDALINKGHKVDLVKLIPILVQAHAHGGCTSEVKRYLEFCINEMDRTDSIVHNFLINIYASNEPEKLLHYLKMQGDNIDSIYYDSKIALRECVSAKQEKAAVHILTVMGLYQEAVTHALNFDIDLAKATADRVRNDAILCKKLWLVITKYLVEESQNVEEAIQIMRECDLIKIEDILPFFPDLLTIDLFKDAICDSLETYSKEIEDLKTEIDYASDIANSMRSEIQVLKQQHTSLDVEHVCHECSTLLMQRPFYLFQCGHKFHQECLCDAVQEFMNKDELSRYRKLKGTLQSLMQDNSRVSGSKIEETSEVKELLDELVAFECLYCGERIVENISKPFIAEEEWEKIMEDWS